MNNIIKRIISEIRFRLGRHDFISAHKSLKKSGAECTLHMTAMSGKSSSVYSSEECIVADIEALMKKHNVGRREGFDTEDSELNG